MKKIKWLLLTLFVLLLCGCGEETITVDNPLTDEEVIKYVQNEIYNETSDLTDVTIVNKEDLLICSFWLDDCWAYDKVDGGYEYELEIVNKDNPEIIGKAIYKDGYIKHSKENGDTNGKMYYYSDYKEQKEIYLNNENKD